MKSYCQVTRCRCEINVSLDLLWVWSPGDGLLSAWWRTLGYFWCSSFFSWLINSHLKEDWTVLNKVDENILHRHPCRWPILWTYCICHQRDGSRALPANLFEHVTVPALKYMYCIMLSLSLIFRQGLFSNFVQENLLVFRCQNMSNNKNLNPSDWYTFGTCRDAVCS
jgi:hypothetical protein